MSDQTARDRKRAFEACHAYYADGAIVPQSLVDAIAVAMVQVRREEREACATLAEEMILYTGYDVAAAIRQREGA